QNAFGLQDNGDETHGIAPSPVVHVRGLCESVVEADLVEALEKFGNICYVMMMPFKRQALVEFEDVESADRCVACGSREAVYIAGQQAYFNYSTSKRITRPTNADDPNSGNKVLLLSIQNPLYPITTDVLYTVCNPIGNVLRIVIFKRNGIQAMVEYPYWKKARRRNWGLYVCSDLGFDMIFLDWLSSTFESVQNAQKAKAALNGADIYAGCCTLKIEYARPSRLNVIRNDNDSWDYTKPFLVRRDLEKAYDRAPREELWYCMRKSGVAVKYVRVVQDMYERSRTVVRCAVGQTEEFKVEVGLHQGSALSPFLFAIVMDQLSEEVRQESPWTMMFADDIVICSESREQVEENLERWRFALERRGMKVSRIQSNGECEKEVKKRVQAETVSVRKRQESELEVAELKMLRFSLGVTRLDRIRNEYIRGTAHVGRLGDKVRETRLRWFGHVQRREKRGKGRQRQAILGEHPSSYGDNGYGSHCPLLPLPSNNRFKRSSHEVPDVVAYPLPQTSSYVGHSSSSVAMVSGLHPTKMNCTRIFNLFCLYGNIEKVKFMKSVPGTALVEMGDEYAVDRAITHLNSIKVFSKRLNVCVSKQHAVIPSQVFELEDGTSSYKDFAMTRNNRFTSAGQASKNIIQPPSCVLHFYNVPPSISEDDLQRLCTEQDVPGFIKYKVFDAKPSSKTISGLLEFDSKTHAVEVLTVLNHYQIRIPRTKEGRKNQASIKETE
ncbi:hypothetical protein QTP86_024802, partial [Hemibagrus guttatus]